MVESVLHPQGQLEEFWQVNMNVSPALVLTAGTYWVDFQFDAGTSGSFVPWNYSRSCGLPSWNGRQFIGTNNTWQDLIDIGEPTAAPQPNVVPDIPLDFPFKLVGSIAETPMAQKPNIDFDNDGKTDYTVLRDDSAPAVATGNRGIFSAKSVRERMQLKNSLPKTNTANWGTASGWI